MKKLTIEALTKPMKKKGLTKGKAILDGIALAIDLDNLYIDFGNEHIELGRITGTKGGYYYSFLCPDCIRRCRVLYKRYLYYSCSSCQSAYKATLSRSKTDCQYYWERALREARKVQPDYTPQRGGYMFDGFPSRPKYMNRDKYYKHYQRFVNYVRKGDSLWLKGLSR